jgi:dolichyl-phosphate-mannose--protein O-mannosyl transferase
MLAATRARGRGAATWTRRTTLRLAGHRRAPVVALVLILLISLGLRLWQIGAPCNAPCKSGTDHGLIFDEAYYVNAARIIDGIRPPAGASYAAAPLHKDPNAEHPQLAKIVIAGGMEVFGDNPWGWRIGSVLFGMLALIALYRLVRGAGGSQWLATGATAVMATDNLALIHSRIATLDIYVLATVLVAAGLYVREKHLLAGIVLGIAGCMKLIGLGVIPAFILLELFRVAWARGAVGAVRQAVLRRGLALVVMLAAVAVTLLVGIWILDLVLPAYDPGTHKLYAGSPFTHIDHMLSYAAELKAVGHATGISSPPWEWLFNQRTINYSRTAVNSLSGGKITASRAVFDARGAMNPFIIFMAIPALFAAVAAAWYERDRVAALGAAWCVGAFLPFVIQYAAFDRISYLYYMLLVMPGVYIVTARLFAPGRVPRAATLGWAVALVYGLANLYPVRSLTGH